MSQSLWSAPLFDADETDRLAALARQAKMPLRAVDPRVLRGLHSRGLVLRPDLMERRESPAIEKPIDEMSLEDLVETQDMEPLSESRRCFLQTGTEVFSLNRPIKDTNGKTILPEDAATEYSLVMLVEPPNLITQRQSDWENEQAQSGNTHITKTIPTEDGRIGLKKVSGWTPHQTFLTLARKIKGYLHDDFGIEAGASYDELEARMALVAEGMRTNGRLRITPEPYERPASERDHSNHDITRTALMGKRGRLYFEDELTEKRYERLEDAGAEPVIVVMGTAVRSGQRRHNPQDDVWTWHHNARDPNELDVTGIADSEPRLIRFVRMTKAEA